MTDILLYGHSSVTSLEAPFLCLEGKHLEKVCPLFLILWEKPTDTPLAISLFIIFFKYSFMFLNCTKKLYSYYGIVVSPSSDWNHTGIRHGVSHLEEPP